MTAPINRASSHSISHVHHRFKIPWEQAFNKFGFNDGDDCQTYTVVAALEAAGYAAAFTPWGLHNDVITSIKKDGNELMPNEGDYQQGYDDPREYLPAQLAFLFFLIRVGERSEITIFGGS